MTTDHLFVGWTSGFVSLTGAGQTHRQADEMIIPETSKEDGSAT